MWCRALVVDAVAGARARGRRCRAARARRPRRRSAAPRSRRACTARRRSSRPARSGRRPPRASGTASASGAPSRPSSPHATNSRASRRSTRGRAAVDVKRSETSIPSAVDEPLQRGDRRVRAAPLELAQEALADPRRAGDALQRLAPKLPDRPQPLAERRLDRYFSHLQCELNRMKRGNATAMQHVSQATRPSRRYSTNAAVLCSCCPSSVSPSALLRCWGEPRPETVDPDRHEPVAAHAVRAERDVQDRRAPGDAVRTGRRSCRASTRRARGSQASPHLRARADARRARASRRRSGTPRRTAAAASSAAHGARRPSGRSTPRRRRGGALRARRR